MFLVTMALIGVIVFVESHYSAMHKRIKARVRTDARGRERLR